MLLQNLSYSVEIDACVYAKDELERLCLKEGDIVRVIRAGDVIPKVVCTEFYISYPTT